MTLKGWHLIVFIALFASACGGDDEDTPQDNDFYVSFNDPVSGKFKLKAAEGSWENGENSLVFRVAKSEDISLELRHEGDIPKHMPGTIYEMELTRNIEGVVYSSEFAEGDCLCKVTSASKHGEWDEQDGQPYLVKGEFECNYAMETGEDERLLTDGRFRILLFDPYKETN